MHRARDVTAMRQHDALGAAIKVETFPKFLLESESGCFLVQENAGLRSVSFSRQGKWGQGKQEKRCHCVMCPHSLQVKHVGLRRFKSVNWPPFHPITPDATLGRSCSWHGRIQDFGQGGPAEFWLQPGGGSLSPKFAYNRGFSLKIALKSLHPPWIKSTRVTKSWTLRLAKTLCISIMIFQFLFFFTLSKATFQKIDTQINKQKRSWNFQKKKYILAVDRIRTCAGRAQQISSLSP